jgi:CubicO group peptidase (beta-lactamase class C family)
VLLGVVIERVSGQSIGEFLGQQFFEPLQLEMVADPNDASAGAARSYRPDGAGFEAVDWHFFVLGTAGIQSTPADLVGWADNYRSGRVGGPALLSGLFEGAEETGFDSSRYGAGIFILPDQKLIHMGALEGFRSVFIVSPDRQRAAAVLCNHAETDPQEVGDYLRSTIWEFR